MTKISPTLLRHQREQAQAGAFDCARIAGRVGCSGARLLCMMVRRSLKPYRCDACPHACDIPKGGWYAYITLQQEEGEQRVTVVRCCMESTEHRARCACEPTTEEAKP